MDGQILFSRHLRLVLKQGYGDQMTDERINKILSSCWQCLSAEHKLVYESLAKDRKYIEDVRGVREHNRHGNNKKAFAASSHHQMMSEMDVFGGSGVAK